VLQWQLMDQEDSQVLQWDLQWLLKVQQLQPWVLMQWELQWEWKVWEKATWVKPWVALCKMECQEQWVELWLVQWQVAQQDQVIWVQWVTWADLWADLTEDQWAIWAQWEEIWVVPWEILVVLLKVPWEDQVVQATLVAQVTQVDQVDQVDQANQADLIQDQHLNNFLFNEE
jgi:hypothetical protein